MKCRWLLLLLLQTGSAAISPIHHSSSFSDQARSQFTDQHIGRKVQITQGQHKYSTDRRDCDKVAKFLQNHGVVKWKFYRHCARVCMCVCFTVQFGLQVYGCVLLWGEMICMCRMCVMAWVLFICWSNHWMVSVCVCGSCVCFVKNFLPHEPDTPLPIMRIWLF